MPAKKRKQEQMEFSSPEWEKFLKTELGQALTAFVGVKKEIEVAQETMGLLNDKVLIEMEKAGKSYIKPQIDGVFYEFELKRTAKKLIFKRAKNG